eukprot:2470787-Rhodomonas_salina.1
MPQLPGVLHGRRRHVPHRSAGQFRHFYVRPHLGTGAFHGTCSCERSYEAPDIRAQLNRILGLEAE